MTLCLGLKQKIYVHGLLRIIPFIASVSMHASAEQVLKHGFV